MSTFLKYCLSIILLISVVTVFSQEEVVAGSTVFIKKGDRFFEAQNYESAIKQYEKALKYDKSNRNLRLKIAESYKENHKNKVSEIIYRPLVIDTLKSIDPKHVLNFSQVLTSNEKYEEAKFWLEYYRRKYSVRSSASQLSFLNNLNYYLKDSSKIHIEQSGFSSDKNEYGPVITKEGILIISDRTSNQEDQSGISFSDLLLVKFSEDSISKSITSYFDNNKRKYHEGPLNINKDQMVITRSLSAGPNKNKLRLYISFRDTLGNWKEFSQMNLMDEGISEGHPTLSTDGRQLFFVSDKNGSKDLYKSVLSDSEWSEPLLLNPKINTPGDEMFPYLHNDSVLYFASNGHPGLGGLDMFSLNLYGADSGQVINLGAPINSSLDDFSLVINQDNSFGYIASNRVGGLGGDDIYKLIFEASKKVFIEGFTKGGRNSSNSNLGNVLIYDKVTNRKLGVSDENGFFKVEIDQEKDYEIALKAMDKKGYEINEEFYEISFEGLIKHKIDTSHIVDLLITDAFTGDTVFVKDQDQKFTYFILEKNKKYNFQANIPEGTEIDIADIEFEGFIKGTKEPIIISEMDIVDHQTQTNLFKSDGNGYFHFPMENGKEYSLVPQSQVAQKIDIWMEGYMKVPDGEFIPPSLHVKNIKGDKYDFETMNGYFGFPTKEGESIEISTTSPDLEKDYEVAEALHFEGFVHNDSSPVSAGKVDVYDSETNQLLFQTDDHGFFSFHLDPKVKYNFLAKKSNGDSLTNMSFKFDGVVKNEKDSMTYANISIVDPLNNQEIITQNMQGFVNFNLKENKKYKVSARSIPIKKEVLNKMSLITFIASDIIKQILLQDVVSGKIFEVSLDTKDHYYTDGIVKRNFSKKIDFDVSKINSLKSFFLEEGVQIGNETIVRSIYYDYNSSKLNANSKKDLLVISDLLKKNKNMKMVVSSHADSRGSSTYNRNLTSKRNKSVIAYLFELGITENRIKQISNGELESLENCKVCTEKDYDLNRRTDFHVISY